jgi:putative membrane protein insertion efficiency factor
MGHRHTSEERGGARAVWNADGGSAAAAAERVRALHIGAPHSFAFAQDKAAPLQRSDARRGIGLRVALFALRFYKAYLSILFAGSCRFQPTCSWYAYEAIERFGVGRGTWLTLKRLLRCQPLSRKFGYDPVPETWESHAI